MKVYVGVDVWIHDLLPSALAGGYFQAPAALPPGKEPLYPLDRMLVGPESQPGRPREEKILDSTGTHTPTSRSSSP
jgi:hypothetical protein